MNDVGSPGMTLEEQSAATWTRYMANTLSMAVEARGPDRERFCRAIRNPCLATPWLHTAEKLTQDPTHLAQKFSSDFSAPNWRYFHVIYTFMEQCSLTWSCLRTISLVNRVNNYFPDQAYLDAQVAGFGAISKQVYDMFHTGACKLRNTLRKPAALKAWKAAVRDPIGGEDDPVGMALKALVDDECMDIIGREMLESWREALDGVLRTEPRDLGAAVK